MDDVLRLIRSASSESARSDGCLGHPVRDGPAPLIISMPNGFRFAALLCPTSAVLNIYGPLVRIDELQSEFVALPGNPGMRRMKCSPSGRCADHQIREGAEEEVFRRRAIALFNPIGPRGFDFSLNW